jgi:ferredoxin
MPYKITIQKEKCIGCGACAAICSNFILKSGKSSVRKAVVDELGCSKEAAESCPVQCIKIEEIAK